jgi:rare lipoprotein A
VAFLAAFLVAYFIRLILPKRKFAIRRSQCDSYIRFFALKVKKKMRFPASGRLTETQNVRKPFHEANVLIRNRLSMNKFFLAGAPSKALRSAQMYFRGRKPAVLFALSAALLFSACAKKKHRINYAASPPSPAQSQIPSSEVGLASWYGHPYHGRAAANGEIYDMEKLTAAHRTLPFNTWVRVTNLSNNKTVDVRIIDRGPFIDGRIIDLSHAAAQAIELIGPGVVEVRIDLIAAPPGAAAIALYGVQVGAFRDRQRAERYRATLETQYGSARIVYQDGTPGLWRVLVGAVNTLDEASLLASRLQTEVGSGFVVRLDDSSTTASR